LSEEISAMMNIQQVPYENLCGCVGVHLDAADCSRFANFLPEREQETIQALIRGGKRLRTVDAGCDHCGGTGVVNEAVALA
jgi:hypothetical protein